MQALHLILLTINKFNIFGGKMSNLLKVRIRKSMNMVSISISIVAVLIAYYVGIEKRRSFQGFLLGIAIWIIALSLCTVWKSADENLSKKAVLKQKCLYLVHIVAFAWIAPFGFLLPFFAEFVFTDEGVPINIISIYEWKNYSLIFTGVFATVFIICQIFKARKNKSALHDSHKS